MLRRTKEKAGLCKGALDFAVRGLVESSKSSDGCQGVGVKIPFVAG